jgi:hypothetical protein
MASADVLVLLFLFSYQLPISDRSEHLAKLSIWQIDAKTQAFRYFSTGNRFKSGIIGLF